MPPMQIDDMQMQMEPMTMRDGQHGDAHGGTAADGDST